MYVEYLYKPNKSQMHVNLTGFLKMNTAQDKHTSYFYQQWNKSSGHRHDEDVDFRPMEISQKIDVVPSEKHKTRCTFKMNCKTKTWQQFQKFTEYTEVSAMYNVISEKNAIRPEYSKNRWRSERY